MKNYHFFLSMLSIINLSYACPYTITNDSQHPIIVVDPNSAAALYLEPNKQQTIDPSIQSVFWKHIKYERLNIYIPTDQPGDFYKAYQLVEKKCAPTTTPINFSEIKTLVTSPSDRLYTIAYNKPDHHHEHNH